MPITLIISKFETGIEIRSLHITIRDEESRGVGSGVAYGVWTPGDGTPRRSRSDRSSRLVVKMLSGLTNGDSNLDLDRCARRLSADGQPSHDHLTPLPCGTDALANFKQELSKQNLYNLKIECSTNEDIEKSPGFLRNTHNQGYASQNFSLLSLIPTEISKASELPDRSDKTKPTIDSISEFLTKKVVSNLEDNKKSVRNSTELTQPSPLEYNIERVKENNAHIMDNIHKLNRTLEYTKKKEILDIICPKSVGTFMCNVCGRNFVYESGLRRHSMRHIGGAPTPRWQDVWTCLECYQVWPKQDTVVSHARTCCSTDINEGAREIKTSSLLQCEFCEKVFTSIPRLVRHSKEHITTRNYECTPCDIGFVSYRAAELHWQVCSWMRHCYTFILAKMFLCNVCDRKFRNYDQLYNHRYKAYHFVTKTHYTQASVGTIEVMVYQCELCSQWYPSVQHLQSHREDDHPQHDVRLRQYDEDCTDQVEPPQTLATTHRIMED